MARRKHSTTHPGVSIVALGDGRHRLRWRELTADGEVLNQSWTVHADAAGAEEQAIAVHRALRASGTFARPDRAAPAPPPRPHAVDLRVVWVDWAKHKADVKRAAAGTLGNLRSSLTAFEGHVRALLSIPEPEPIPADVLDDELCARVMQRVRTTPRPRPRGNAPADPAGPKRKRKPRGRPLKPPGEHRVSQIMRFVHQAWVWASAPNRAERYPGLRPAPLKSDIVPPPPPPGEPLLSPAWAEMDAILHAARASRSPDAADILEICRGTGLRSGQVTRLLVQDFLGLDSPVPAVKIRGELGKSRRERTGRTVPLAPVLVPLVRRLIAGKAPSDRLFTRKATLSSETMREILVAAEALGLRRGVWRDDQRGNDRTTHMMRAGLQRGLRRAGIEDRVIDRLVGHDPRSTRDQHYDGAEDPELIEAVRCVPAVQSAADEGRG